MAQLKSSLAVTKFAKFTELTNKRQCFAAVGLAAGRSSGQ